MARQWHMDYKQSDMHTQTNGIHILVYKHLANHGWGLITAVTNAIQL